MAYLEEAGNWGQALVEQFVPSIPLCDALTHHLLKAMDQPTMDQNF